MTGERPENERPDGFDPPAGLSARRADEPLVSSAGPPDDPASGAQPLDEPQPASPLEPPAGSTPTPPPASPGPPDRPADPERPADPVRAADAAAASAGAGPDIPFPPGGGTPGPDVPPAEAPGLREQVGATKDAVKGLIGAHVELGKAEMADIGDAIKKVAAMAGVAVAAGLAAALLIGVGLPLFLGEWIFGSMGWGLLHGLLFLVAVIVAAALAAVDIPATRIGASLLLGVFVGAVVAVVLGLNLTNRAWTLAGDALLPGAAADVRPLATALVVLPIVAAVLAGLAGLVAGLRRVGGEPGSAAAVVPAALFVAWLSAFLYAYSTGVAWFDPILLGVGIGGLIAAALVLYVLGRWPTGAALVAGLSLGVVIGLVLALGTAVAFGARVGAAVGVAVGLGTWIGGMVFAIASDPPDMEALKNKFIPQKTIDMTKETMEWARARMPLKRGS